MPNRLLDLAVNSAFILVGAVIFSAGMVMIATAPGRAAWYDLPLGALVCLAGGLILSVRVR